MMKTIPVHGPAAGAPDLPAPDLPAPDLPAPDSAASQEQPEVVPQFRHL